jgi:hypothetical protein
MDFQWNPRRKLSCLPSINQTWQWQVVFLHEHKHVQTCLMFSIAMLFFLSTPTFKGSILHFKGLLFTKMAASPPGGVGLRVLRTPLTGPGSCALHGGGRVHPEMNGSPAVLKKKHSWFCLVRK